MVNLNIDLPESFFLEEERDGYLVSAKTKELWAVQLDLLNEFNRVCKKHNLKYILDFGTLLGAVRHKGFIPWDEDIDVSMLREDYDKLMKLGPKEFKHPYFFQNFETEQGYDVSVTRLRRSDTTFLQPPDILNHSKYNLGIFIDIFVFDDVPTNDLNEISKIKNQCECRYNAVKVFARRNRKYSSFVMSILMFLRNMYYKLIYGTSYNAFKQMDTISKQYTDEGFVSCLFTTKILRCRPKEWMKELVFVPFESLTVPVPAAYDKVLRALYGAYETPVIDDASTKMWFFDTGHSYKELIHQKGFYKNLMKELSINPGDYYALGLKDVFRVLKWKINSVFH